MFLDSNVSQAKDYEEFIGPIHRYVQSAREGSATASRPLYSCRREKTEQS